MQYLLFKLESHTAEWQLRAFVIKPNRKGNNYLCLIIFYIYLFILFFLSLSKIAPTQRLPSRKVLTSARAGERFPRHGEKSPMKKNNVRGCFRASVYYCYCVFSNMYVSLGHIRVTYEGFRLENRYLIMKIYN